MLSFTQKQRSSILPVLLFWCYLLYTQISFTTSLAAANTNALTNSVTELEPINGTLNYRIYGKKGRDEKPWFDGRLDRHIQCVRRGRCEKITDKLKTCLGAKVPFTYTSLDLADYQSQEHVAERLRNYQALRYVPKCWAVIQPFLCAVFVPKCEQINNQEMVYLPSLEMCRLTLEPCRILYNTSYFPEFLRCNETLFPPKCSNDVREMKFNITGSCLAPLVAAESSASYYPGIEGCGIQCKDPLYTDDEHRQIQKLKSWCGTMCFLANLFVVATFLIDWDNANKYPALIVFYINLCFLIATFGWLLQFTPGSREDIVCRKDGTLRHSEPTAGENLSCIVIFVLIYYFLVAAMVWFVFLTYAWHLRAVGNVQDRIDKSGSYFHLVAWSLPLVLTITTMALSEVDGNSTAGICFVGYLNHTMRAALLLGPLGGVVLVGGYFIIRGMIKLFGLKHFAKDIESATASNKIHLIIVRMSLCAAFTLLFIFVVIACHVYEFKHTTDWNESLKKSIICHISSTFTDDHFVKSSCKLESRPSVAVLQLHLLCLFGGGIVMSTWCWTPSSIEAWKRYIKKKFGKEVVEDVKMPKHKVIAQTWAKRKEFEDKGRLSITLCNTHTDPVGLNFDVNGLNSSETNEISSSWANCLPKFVTRRAALTGVGTTNSSSQGPRKSSFDSEISFSLRHVSVESRRNSVDSQVSVKFAEMKTKVASRARVCNPHHHHYYNHHGNSKHSKNSRRRRDFMATGAATTGCRASSTSVGLFTQSTKKHHTKRRSANAGLNAEDISAFMAKNSALIWPFLQAQTTSSDEDVDELSHTSFKVKDSRLNVVVKKEHDGEQDDDDDDDDAYEDYNSKQIVEQAPHIEEIYDDDEIDDVNARNQAKKQALFENYIKSMQKSNESTGNRQSRNSTRSRQSRKSNALRSVVSGNSIRRSQKHRNVGSSKQQKTTAKSDFVSKAAGANADADDDIGISISSYSSEDFNMPLGALLHSSYSGISTGKPNSRNSKTSCDIGIQANACEIVEEERKETMRQLNAKNRRKSDNNYDNDYGTEMQTLLDGKSSRKEAIVAMTESDKLKRLLLPSK